MSKNILIISASLRKSSNSDALAEEFKKGALEAGNNVDKIDLAGKRIEFCKGCLACQNTQQCVIKDDAIDIADRMLKADVIVFATPIYYYGLSGQLKTLLDRANPLYTTDYAFRDIYLLASAADDEEGTIDGTVTGLNGWIVCYEKSHLAGTVFAGGVNEPGEVKGHRAMQEAYNMGNSIK